MDKPTPVFMSYNIFCGGFSQHNCKLENPERLPQIKSVIRFVNPDFCTLIDAYGWEKIYDKSMLMKMFNYPYANSINLDDTHHDLSDSTTITILSRLPVIRSQIIRIFSRNAIVTTLKIDDQEVDVVSVYLDYEGENLRLKQIKALVENLSLDRPTIINGDLNSIENHDHIKINLYLAKFVITHPLFALQLLYRYIDMSRNRVIQFIVKNGFKDADQNHLPTVPTKLIDLSFPRPVLHVDYAFSRGNIDLYDFQVPKGQIFDEASDHYPISFKAKII
jgi:endonuclease/exonuclease/phosphatase family metal-dependent hydrolase